MVGGKHTEGSYVAAEVDHPPHCQEHVEEVDDTSETSSPPLSGHLLVPPPLTSPLCLPSPELYSALHDIRRQAATVTDSLEIYFSPAANMFIAQAAAEEVTQSRVDIVLSFRSRALHTLQVGGIVEGDVSERSQSGDACPSQSVLMDEIHGTTSSRPIFETAEAAHSCVLMARSQKLKELVLQSLPTRAVWTSLAHSDSEVAGAVADGSIGSIGSIALLPVVSLNSLISNDSSYLLPLLVDYLYKEMPINRRISDGVMNHRIDLNSSSTSYSPLKQSPLHGASEFDSPHREGEVEGKGGVEGVDEGEEEGRGWGHGTMGGESTDDLSSDDCSSIDLFTIRLFCLQNIMSYGGEKDPSAASSPLSPAVTANGALDRPEWGTSSASSEMSSRMFAGGRGFSCYRTSESASLRGPWRARHPTAMYEGSAGWVERASMEDLCRDNGYWRGELSARMMVRTLDQVRQ